MAEMFPLRLTEEILHHHPRTQQPATRHPLAGPHPPDSMLVVLRGAGFLSFKHIARVFISPTNINSGGVRGCRADMRWWCRIVSVNRSRPATTGAGLSGGGCVAMGRGKWGVELLARLPRISLFSRPTTPKPYPKRARAPGNPRVSTPPRLSGSRKGPLTLAGLLRPSGRSTWGTRARARRDAHEACART